MSAQQSGCIPFASGSVTIVGSVTAIRPSDAVCGSQAANLTAARNEFESFQVVVRAAAAAIANVSVITSALTGPNGAAISRSDITVYRVGNYVAQIPSDSEGGTGPWPDALIPAVDHFFGQQRNAFPISVPGGENRVAWIDVFVPPGTAPGSYSGTATVTAGGVTVTIPIGLKVINATLPSTSSLRSAFATNFGRPCTAHTGHSACNFDETRRWSLHALYAQAALDNRITISNPFPLGVDQGPSAAQAAQFRTFILPMMRPDQVPFHNQWQPGRLRDAQLTSVELHNLCGSDCLTRWRGLATAAPRFDERFFLVCIDEPSTAAHWNACRTAVQTAAASWPGLATMVTTTIQQARPEGIDSIVTILNPIINRMHDKPFANSCCRGNQRAAYDEFLTRPGTEVWLYTSNLSYSSDESVDPYWDGWAGYAIDAPASQSRAMGWLTFSYDVSGELYYHTTNRLSTAWTPGGLYEQGGNGDGTLFYPGTTAVIGGQTDIPIESIRMKRIRDGYEDHEYLRLLVDAGAREFAMSEVRALFPSPYQTTVTQGALDAARQRLAARIESLAGPVAPVLILSPARVNFAMTRSGTAVVTTPPQTLSLTQSAPGSVAWTATASVPWLTVTPGAGAGPATLSISLNESAGGLPDGESPAIVTVSSSSSMATTSVVLTRVPDGRSAAPFGVIDTPAEGASDLSGSIAVSGWALDDVAVKQVRIVRDSVAGEAAGQVPIGTAVFIDGARPDVAAYGATFPRNTRGGWGLLVLTNVLPNQGNGTFRFHAIAEDVDGHSTVLGSRTFTCNNAGSVVPFGALDTPGQGETIRGSQYPVFGWVLVRGPALAHPPYGTVTMVIDGVAMGSPGGWTSRPDLTGVFPAATYAGVTKALGVAALDTTTLANGIHTISWVVTADNGKAAAIGSRFFIVDNSK
jgi:hypothetical protein